jgi:lysophospholipase L1-like esterase
MRRWAAAGVVALLVMLAGGVLPGGARAEAVECPAPAAAPKVILTIGDSITEGATMQGSVSPSYRAELGRLLDAACIPHTMVSAALGGTTCGYWSSRIAGLMATHHPDVVLINCGTNNRLDNASADTIAAFEATYRGLFDVVMDSDPNVLAWPAWVQYSAGRPSTGCTTPPGPSPSWLPASEAKVNDAIYRSIRVHAEAGDRIPGWIDYQAIPEGYLDQCGVHPTAGGYDVMGRIAYNAIAPYLVTVPTAELPCGLTGRRPGGQVPDWVPCQQMNLNP